jgi:hypothetical protein
VPSVNTSRHPIEKKIGKFKKEGCVRIGRPIKNLRIILTLTIMGLVTLVMLFSMQIGGNSLCFGTRLVNFSFLPLKYLFICFVRPKLKNTLSRPTPLYNYVALISPKLLDLPRPFKDRDHMPYPFQSFNPFLAAG